MKQICAVRGRCVAVASVVTVSIILGMPCGCGYSPGTVRQSKLQPWRGIMLPEVKGRLDLSSPECAPKIDIVITSVGALRIAGFEMSLARFRQVIELEVNACGNQKLLCIYADKTACGRSFWDAIDISQDVNWFRFAIALSSGDAITKVPFYAEARRQSGLSLHLRIPSHALCVQIVEGGVVVNSKTIPMDDAAATLRGIREERPDVGCAPVVLVYGGETTALWLARAIVSAYQAGFSAIILRRDPAEVAGTHK